MKHNDSVVVYAWGVRLLRSLRNVISDAHLHFQSLMTNSPLSEAIFEMLGKAASSSSPIVLIFKTGARRDSAEQSVEGIPKFPDGK